MRPMFLQLKYDFSIYVSDLTFSFFPGWMFMKTEKPPDDVAVVTPLFKPDPRMRLWISVFQTLNPPHPKNKDIEIKQTVDSNKEFIIFLPMVL